MPLPPEKQRALREYALQLSATLSDVQPASVRALTQEVISRLGELACVQHSHLLLLQGDHEPELFGSVIAEWSAVPMPLVLPELQHVPMQLFSRQAVQELKAGAPFYSEFDETEHACSKLVSGLLRELSLHAYEMIPVISCGRLKAVVGLVQKAGCERLDELSLQMIQLTASVFMRFLTLARRERQRKRKHLEWKQVVNGACDFALKVDSRLEIIEVIPFRQQKPPNVDGLLLTEFVSRSSCESVLEVVQSVHATSQPRSIQFFAINASARPCSYAARIKPAPQKARRRDLTFYLTNNDLEQTRTEELISLRDQLDRATRLSLLGNIATEFAHQLTQPLQAISNHLYTLSNRVQKGQPPETILSCARNIETSVEHAAAIIKSLRDFVTNRRMTLAPSKLATMVYHAITMVGTQSDRTGAKIHLQDPYFVFEPETSPLVYVDAVQTTHVIINLLVNAMEACEEAEIECPEITITAGPASSPNHILIQISDNGPGLPLDTPDSVFDRFFTTKTEGFGIGLAICRDVIERQHGNIRVENNPTCGCCFSFTLPLCSGDEEESDDLPEHDESPDTDELGD
jgi:signal transduction histidine kinase